MIKTCKCVVIANGSFPSAEIPLQLLRSASVIIACDGAVENLYQHGFTPETIIGDMDSIPDKLREIYAGKIITIEDQEINDLTKAVHFAQNMGQKEILIMGATGLREDHTLGNISLLADYMSHFRRIEMVTDYGWFTSISESTTLNSYPGQQISIFSLSPSLRLTTTGLRWPIADRALTSWWQGTLNEATGTEFRIKMEEKGKLIIYRTHPFQHLL